MRFWQTLLEDRMRGPCRPPLDCAANTGGEQFGDCLPTTCLAPPLHHCACCGPTPRLVSY